MPIPTLIVKIIENKAIYSMPGLHLYVFSFSAIFASSTVSVHSSTNLSTTFYLHLQFS